MPGVEVTEREDNDGCEACFVDKSRKIGASRYRLSWARSFTMHTIIARWNTTVHMGCRVQWHRAARSRDYPCHGGRFGATGAVLCAPSTPSQLRLSALEIGPHEETIR
jgi:Rieske Fe-S protein